jgi:histidinol-phosphate phosphatase family protein
VFLDRDGVLNELVPDPRSGFPESPLDPADVALLPGVVDAVGRLRNAGYLIIGISNQPAAAKGVVPLNRLEAVQRCVLDLFAREGIAFDSFRICFHHPDGSVAGLRIRCSCRKPAPGMLLDAASELHIDLVESWMIGDTDTDIQAGEGAGARTILIEHDGSRHKRHGLVRPDATANNLRGAVDVILDSRTG